MTAKRSSSIGLVLLLRVRGATSYNISRPEVSFNCIGCFTQGIVIGCLQKALLACWIKQSCFALSSPAVTCTFALFLGLGVCGSAINQVASMKIAVLHPSCAQHSVRLLPEASAKQGEFIHEFQGCRLEVQSGLPPGCALKYEAAVEDAWHRLWSSVPFNQQRC